MPLTRTAVNVSPPLGGVYAISRVRGGEEKCFFSLFLFSLKVLPGLDRLELGLRLFGDNEGVVARKFVLRCAGGIFVGEMWIAKVPSQSALGVSSGEKCGFITRITGVACQLVGIVESVFQHTLVVKATVSQPVVRSQIKMRSNAIKMFSPT